MLSLVVELVDGAPQLPPAEQIADVLTVFGTLDAAEAQREAEAIVERGDVERLHRLISAA